MKLPALRTLDVAHKTVLVRIDCNSEIRNGNVVPSPRLFGSVETIKELRRRKAKVVLLAHQGRPGSSDYTSLKQHAALFNSRVKLRFVPDVIGKTAQKAITSLQDGDIIMLDNVRSVSDEFEPDKKQNILVNVLAPLVDCYVNDAFSVSHRAQTSIVSFPKHMPHAMGLLLEKELAGAAKLNINHALLVLGGAKPEDNVLLAKARPRNKILANGLFGPYCLMAQGISFGKENSVLKKELQEARILKKCSSLITPSDFAIQRKGKRLDIALSDLPVKEEIFDIGPDTIARFSQEILEAKAVFFKGLSGLCNTDAFSVGTRVLLKALEYSKAYSIVCGGHTTTALERFKIDTRKIGHISLAGGALVQYLAGEKLPGLEALKS